MLTLVTVKMHFFFVVFGYHPVILEPIHMIPKLAQRSMSFLSAYELYSEVYVATRLKVIKIIL